MPVFSVDKEENGFPKEAQNFLDKIEEADLLVISLAEHNGAYSAAFKNILDWTSRINAKSFSRKKNAINGNFSWCSRWTICFRNCER